MKMLKLQQLLSGQHESYDCRQCYRENDVFPMIMIVCRLCGNKRCPKAENHQYKCTGSNDLNQVGEWE